MIENPIYKLKENNIFLIRKNEYNSLLDNIRMIVDCVREIDFEVEECNFRESRFSTGELCRTLKKTLNIKLKRGESLINFSLQIPKLVDDYYIIINGRKKLPQFQLYDIPIVTRGKGIKLRTNVTQIMVMREKETPYVYISFLGKKVPMHLIMFAYFGTQGMNEKFNITSLNSDEIEANTIYNSLLKDICDFYEDSNNRLSQDDIIRELGKHFSKYDARGKGEDAVFALDLILKSDPILKSFFKTNSILDELVYTMNNNYDDTDVRNKRIRCFEYIVLSKVSKIIFDFCMANRTAREPKFNINSTQILSECNVSDIIQFDFSINPIEELTKLTRLSLVGPGGFSKQNVPEHLRDINDSMFGRICPVDTPDRENCGVLQNIIPNVYLDTDLRFEERICEKQPVSVPVSMVPFLEHDDQTRLQMSASQMRQAIMLRKFEEPIIQSGCEGLYTNKTQFIKIAKKDGVVAFLDEKKYIIVIYEDEEVEIFDISYRKIYISNLDIYKIYVKQGDKITKGQILAESNFSNGGKITIGRNLLTAFMGWYGYNYEDGIVISDRLVKENVFTSVHYLDMSFTIPKNSVLLSLYKKIYKPLPFEKDNVKAGNPYAILKTIPENQQDFLDIFRQEKKILAPHDFYVTECNIYANEWNKEVPEYDEWISNKIQEQQDKENKLKDIISSHLGKSKGDKFIRDNNLDIQSYKGNFRIKEVLINGVLIEMFGIYFRQIEVGDKIANRHGNKGIISIVVPHENMPKLPDGRHVDICINPLCIISRMNIGQLFELHLSESVYDLKKKMKKILNKEEEDYKDSSDEDIQNVLRKYLLDYIKIVDFTKDSWFYTQFEKEIPNIIDEEFIDSITLIQPPFESLNLEAAIKALKYTNSSFKQKIFDCISNEYIQEEIAVGNLYFFKMVHIAQTRLAARGIGSYERKTLQPLAGRKYGGGQRSGEMEMACLTGHDASLNLSEFLTTKSDCIDLKKKFIRDKLSNKDYNVNEGTKECSNIPESVLLFDAYLNIIGIKR